MSSGVHVTVCRHQCQTVDRSVLTDHWGWINTESRRQYTATAIHQLAWFMARTRLQEVKRHSTTGQRGFLPCICLIFWFNIEDKATIYKKRPFIIFWFLALCFVDMNMQKMSDIRHILHMFTIFVTLCFARPFSFSNRFFKTLYKHMYFKKTLTHP